MGDEAFRRARVPGKKALRELNRKLQEAGYKPVTERSLARHMRSHEIPPEMINILLEVEALLA